MIKKIIELKRLLVDSHAPTPGVLFDGVMPFAVSLELPDRGNQPFISCVNPGEYFLKRYSSTKYPNVWQLVDVKGRDLVLTHWGSFLKDTQGCILIGEKFADLNNDGVTEIAESKVLPNEGFNEFMNRLKDCGDMEVKLIIQRAERWIA